jgi:hypothetical protein
MEIQIEKIKDNFLKTALPRFFLFVTTYLIAVISAGGKDALLFLLFTFLLPAGLFVNLVEEFTNTPAIFSIFLVWPLLVGWAIYISITVIGIMVKNRYVFVAIYIIFILLLITSIAGCKAATAGIE